MVNIDAGVAEATVVGTAVKVFTIAVSYIVSLYPRVGVQYVIDKTFRQGSTSRSAVSPDHILEGGMAVAS